jgi:hypothetical protein
MESHSIPAEEAAGIHTKSQPEELYTPQALFRAKI